MPEKKNKTPSTDTDMDSSSTALLIPYWLAILFRLFLFNSLSTKWDLASRAEVATPINSHKRLIEGVYLERSGVNPYSGVIFHETPLVLKLMEMIMDHIPTRLNNLWIFADLVTAYVIGLTANRVAERILKKQKSESGIYHTDASELMLGKINVETMGIYAQLLYLFNPYTMINCAARTTTVLDNLALALFLLCMMKRQKILSCFFLSLAAYKSLYPIMLLSPLCLSVSEDLNIKNWQQGLVKAVLPVLTLFTLFLGGLLWISYEVMDRDSLFLSSTYGFILSVPELTPNMGLFWYFFTEMFEHFRLFFVCTFQLNVFVYAIPLSIKLRRDPFLLAFTLLGLTAIFKSYPGYGDVGFYLSLLPMLKHLFPYTKQLFIVACMLLATTVLGPIVYHLWIYNGSANANYFFAINLVFGTAEIFLVTDLLFANVKRNFYLYNGYKELRASQTKGDKRLILK